MGVVAMTLGVLVLISSAGASTGSAADALSFVMSTLRVRDQAILFGSTAYAGAYAIDASVRIVEERRPAAWQAFQERTGTHILSIETIPSFRSVESEGDVCRLSVYVWTSFDWTDASGVVVRSGMGTPHEIVLRRNGASWEILSDVFDEGPLTGICYPSAKWASQTGPEQSVGAATPLGDPGSTYYNRNAAANYSDQYVDHSAYGSYVPSAYNNAIYRNYASGGGDCANFTSQCMRAGGAYLVGAFSNPSSTSVWWYNDNGTTPNQTGDDSASSTWYYCPKQIQFVLAGWGSTVGSSQLQRGDLVYYDWKSDGAWDHVAVVAAFDGSGRPLVNCHTNDYYHVIWNYGGTGCSYDCIHIKDYI